MGNAKRLRQAGLAEGDPVPRARLRPPANRALPRQRLLGGLTASSQRLILVTGPAGCGKTTLLSQFAGHDPERIVVWYQLDAGDARAPVLFRHLAQALGRAVAGVDVSWDSVEHAADVLDAARADNVLVVLDDLHLLAGSAGEEALGRLLDLAPPWLQVAAACRQPPGWNLSRLRVSGDLLEVGADDLRFRSWEVERLFTDFYREPLPPGDVAQLTRGLEGWAAGLQLFHLATRGKPVSDRRRAVAALPARSKLIREYLTGNVLADLPDELRDFLIDTSPLGHLSPALCDELRGSADSLRLLDELEARQVFVERLDEDRSFRYHEVFRTYLEGRLVERDGQAQARVWSQRAAGLLETDGRMLEALRAYCRAEDWISVGRVLETAGAELVDDSVSWLDWLPPGLIEGDPWAMLAAARRAAATGRFATALDLYARAEQVAGAASAAGICRRERAGIAGWIDATAPPPRGWGGRIRAALRTRPAELTALPPGTQTEGAHAGRALAAGVARLLTGDVGGATRALVGPIDDPDADPGVVAVARVTLAVVRALGPGVVDVELDDLTDLVELAELAETSWLAWIARAASALDGSAAGWQQARAAADALDRQGDAWGGAAARFFAVVGAVMAQGCPADELEDLAARLVALDAAVPACWCQAWQATALARRTALGSAADVAIAAEQAAERTGVPGAQVWAITVRAQLAEAEGATEDARSHAERAAALRRAWGIDVVVPPLQPDRPAPAQALGGTGVSEGPPGPAATPVRVRCLGGFFLEVAGRPVDLRAAKPRMRAALRLLAVQAGRPVHVETLIEALWPGGDPVAGKRNVQVALSSLRRLLDEHEPGAGALIARRDNGYLLSLPPRGEADVVSFAAARDECRAAAGRNDVDAVLASGSLALLAYGGDLLPEEGPAEWVVQPRRNLARDAAETAVVVAENAIASGRYEAAVAASTRGLDIDSYNDALWRLLALAHERGGDPAAAARAQERYHALLSDLGV